MIAYKLLSKKKDGSIGPLFINRRLRLEIGKWYQAENYPTKGYAVRPGFHCTTKPEAPHLSEKDRVWCMVDIEDYREFERPEHQGGKWLLANRLKVIKEL